MPEPFFINVTGPDTSRRDHELKVARARSHAAHLSWSSRRRLKNKQRNARELVNQGAITEVGSDAHERTNQEVATEVSSDALQRTGQQALTRVVSNVPERLNPDVVRIPSPLGFINCGSSDPFDSLAAISVTPQINEIISYTRTRFQTMIVRAPNSDQVGSRTFLLEEYQDYMKALHNEQSAPALLFNFVSYMSNEYSGSSKLELQKLELKQKAFKSLKALLDNNRTRIAPVLLKSLVPMFGGAVLAGDFREAEVHGLQIGRVLEQMRKHPEPCSFETALDVLRVYYIDIQLGLKRMRKPILRPECGVEILKPFLKSSDPIAKADKPSVELELDESLHTEPLRTCFTRIRLTLPPHISPPANPVPSNAIALSFWPMLTTWNIFSLLQALFETARSHLEQQPRFEQFLSWQVQGMLALSLMAYMCNFGRSFPTLTFGSVASLTDSLLPALRTLLSQRPPVLPAEGAPTDAKHYHRARLWALFMGASCELQEQSLSTTTTGTPWLVTEFARQARRMQLVKWEKMKPVLDRFEPVDILEPHGLKWVDKLFHDTTSLGGNHA